MLIPLLQPGQGSLTIDAQAHDGEFGIENISFYKDEKLATELTAEADWNRRGLYIGPQVSAGGVQYSREMRHGRERRRRRARGRAAVLRHNAARSRDADAARASLPFAAPLTPLLCSSRRLTSRCRRSSRPS